MSIGYARVSTSEQNLHLQIDALQRVGCARIFTDHGVSGANFSRPGLDRVLALLQSGDTLVVWRLDRLGRSLARLVEIVNLLAKRGVEFVSVNEAINTQSPGGVFIFHLMAALAEFERSLISERTRAGLAAARARGTQLGRRSALSPDQRAEIQRLVQTLSVREIAAQFNVHPRTIKRLLGTRTVIESSLSTTA
ncbi:hypothetical protein WI58_15170 [Burkholderia cepacia]|uniref:recombinase family protein n=1 Tax=Burkholderia cepacia TaxID=292 RepID=UPI00075A6508|nr:recombinase family protein [Burkholderia cepacia]KVA46790.1 hypothetical protein WI47_21270 [Burkholderia cepacia]KVA51589.1 hypothetical protein WI48_26015 [Burkholderia cepacia]KVA70852.1 hypothetical protein WI49_35490 [Burkholderia cepacia]KVA78912.1 hypothetical protein WI51_27730 [Burkholderia cepacia]KVA78934.1 hypothetical protein WI52_25620 [Burkholderia cepacia]